MNYAKWIEHFARNKLNRPEPDWSAPVAIQSTVLAALLPSLEQFRLGDGGGPASLIAGNAESYRGRCPELRIIVDAWFAEEAEHARLLGCAVKRLGGRFISSHWSFSSFCLCRRVLGVRFELQVLLLTELVSTAYYRVLRRHVPDVPVADLCSLILRDEAGHVAFHRDRLAAASRSPLGLTGAIWQAQFWLCGLAAATVLWTSHRRCLTTIGGSRTEYFQEVQRELGRFVLSLGRTVEWVKRPRDAIRPLNSLAAKPIHSGTE